MGIIKNAIANQQKAQLLSMVAIGVSVFTLLCVFAMMGGKGNAR